MRRPEYAGGLLAFVPQSEAIPSLDAHRLHRILLAYYRILQANRDLPRDLHWPLDPLARLVWTPHPDCGVRFLAIRCYAIQTGMVEGERVKMEKEMIGEVADVGCPIEYGKTLDGKNVVVDGWVMPALEVTRIYDSRNAPLDAQDYYISESGDSVEPIHPAELRYVLSCPFFALLMTSGA